MKLLLLLTFPVFAYSQDQPMIKGDTLFMNGQKIFKGQMLRLGTGSRPDGDFKFVRVNSGSLLRYVGDDAYRSEKNSANSLEASFAGMSYKIVRIERRGTKKSGYVSYPIINIGMTRYEVDILRAVAAGEIILPGEPKPEAITAKVQPTSAADELKKWKELLDAGAINQNEYDSAKKKILAQQ